MQKSVQFSEKISRILCKRNKVEPQHAPGGWGLGAVEHAAVSLSRPLVSSASTFSLPSFSQPQPSTPALIPPLPSGPWGSCTHPARSDNAYSPRPSAGRPCCSRNACGGGRSSASALTPISDTCEFPLSFPHPLSSQLRPPQPLPLGHP